MLKLIALLVVAQLLILMINFLKAEFADAVSLTLENLLNPTFWLKNPVLFVILALAGLWFIVVMLATKVSSVITGTRYTASLYTLTVTTIYVMFMLIQLSAFQIFRSEKITPDMWIYVTVGVVYILIGLCVLYHVSLRMVDHV